MTDKPVPTEEQEAIIQGASGPSPMMITAYAGCAKSSSLEMAAPRVRTAALALAFNKKIADELKGRLPGQFQVKTLNGLGHGALLRGPLTGRRLQLDDRKLGKVVSAAARDLKVELAGDQWDQTRTLVTKAMQAGVVPGNQGQGLQEDAPGIWRSLADECGVDESETELLVELARNALAANNDLTRSGVISFDDQVYASVCLGGRFVRYPVVFVDEAQDLSPLNHEMLRRSLAQGGKLVAVGDPKQAIYAWRGADARSMETLRGLTGGWKDYGLTMTFRCPRVVVVRQQKHAPGFRTGPGAPEGQFVRLGGLQGGPGLEPIPWTWFQVQKLVSNRSLAVLCRNNAPLFKLAFRLLRRSIPVVMLGRDIGRGLVTLARKLGSADMSAQRFALALAEWRERESSIAEASGKTAKAEGVHDRAECLLAVLEGTQAKDVGQLVRQLETLFAREEATVTLSSIHKAKGLEWDCVLHLDPWRPGACRKRAEKTEDWASAEQEENLEYVAETRTRGLLVEADLEGMK